MNRYLKGTLLALVALFGLLTCFAIGLLVYVLGEPAELDLGVDEASFVVALQEQLRLGHVVLTPDGERVVIFGEVTYQFHVLTIQERVGVGFIRAFHGDYGQAISQNATVGSLIGWPLGRSFLYLFAFGLFSFLPGVFAPKERKGKRALLYGGLALGLMGLGFGFFFGWGLPYVGLAFLGAALLLGLFAINQVWLPRLSIYARSMVVSFFFLLLEVGLFAAYPQMQEAGSLLSFGVGAKDNHLLAPMTFFLCLQGFVCLCVALLLAVRKKKEAKA